MQGYSSIMVGLDLGAGASERVKLAADLADRFNATLIGFACRQPMQEVLGDTSPLAAAILEQERRLEEEESREGRRALPCVGRIEEPHHLSDVHRHTQYLLCGLCVGV